MNWFDFLAIGTWAVGFMTGWRIGLFGAIFATAGLLFGVLLAGRFSDNISDLMTESISSDTLATVISYMAIICTVFIGFQILQDASVYEWTGYENVSAVSEGNIKAASEAGGKQAD